MTKREFLDIVFDLAPTEANRIMDAFDEYVESTEPHWIPVTENCDCDKMDKCEKLQLPPASCSEFPNNSDTISRQAAIDIVDFECGEWRGLAKTIEQAIERLPSAQPEDCDTCKHGYFGNSQCENCRVRYPSHYERRTDEQVQGLQVCTRKWI